MSIINRRGLLIGAAAIGFILPANAAYTPINQAMLNALDYNVKGDGSTNDAAASQTFINLCNTTGAIAFFPGGKTYNFGSAGVTVPSNTIVFCGAGAIFQRSGEPANYAIVQTKANLMFSLGSNVRFYNGELTKTSTLGTSVTSNTVGTGSKTFATQSGLGILTNDFMRIWSQSNPKSYIEGLVTSYSGTSLTINATFSGGSGTKTDWIFDWEGVYQTPISFNNCDNTIIDGTKISGFWYEGFLFDGENASGTSLICTNCTLKNCYAFGILNRAIDIYGNVARWKVIGCTIDGNGYTTDYGINANAANNPSNQGQTIVDGLISDCSIVRCQFQGIAMGDSALHNAISNCIVNDLFNSASVGYELVYANGNSPQFNTITGCIAQSVVGQGFGIYGANYTSVTGCSAFTCGDGFKVISSVNNSQENNILDLMAVGCTTGVNLGTGSINSYVSGRATANTTNLSTTGSTGSNTTNLIVV